MSTLNWSDYQKHWDRRGCYFSNKQAAATFADALAPALDISRKGVVVEGRKGEFHVFIPFIGRYWMPVAELPKGWEGEFWLFQKLIKEAKQS